MPAPRMTEFKPADIDRYLAQVSIPEAQLSRFHKPGAPLFIFDVGSCEGEDSVRYARRFPRARIHAFEPLPANQTLIQKNLENHEVGNVTVSPVALSAQTGEAVFHVSAGRPAIEFAGKDWNYGNKSSSLLPPAGESPMYGWVHFPEKITVPTRTLDDYCEEHAVTLIDFVHMDVQGAELLVLKGARRMLPRIDALWLEVSDQSLYQGQVLRPQMEAFMRSRGFALLLQEQHAAEGDQFYVNLRNPRFWPALIHRRARALASRLKRAMLSLPPGSRRP
jgi:FkbM family methyltransferase